MKNTRLRKLWFLVGLLFTLTKIGYAQCGPGQDITRPTFAEPYFSLDVYVECEDDVVVTPPTPMDDCTTNPTLDVVEDLTTPGSCPNQFIRIINYQAEDDAGNTALYSLSVQVLDLTPPVFDQEPNELNQIVSCEADIVITPPTATDNCGVDEITVFSTENEQIGDCPFNFNRTVTYRAVDECNNFSFYTIVYTVQDDNAPTFDLEVGALNQTVSCISEIETFEIPTATDDCSEAQVQLLTDETAEGACENNSVRTITYEATDLCGNASQYQVVITVNDEIAPVITSALGELDFAFDCSDGGEIEIPIPTATDNCEGNIEVYITSDETNAGDCAGNSVRTVTYVAADACGNESEPYTVNITIGDTSPPEWITEVNALNAEYSCDEIADLVIPIPEANDLCGNATVELTTSNTIEMGCAGSSQLVYIYNAIDECGNVSDAEFIVTITIVDNIAPSFTDEPGALDITLSCDEVAGLELPVPQAIDNCSETEVVLINDEISNSETCLAESVRVLTYQAIDVCGNEGGTYSVTISVFDNVPPSINGLFDENVTAGCGEIPTVPLVQVLDNCDSDIELVYSADTVEGNCAGGYIITRTWSATDDCGNNTERTQTIAVEDNLMPVITAVPASTVISCDTIPEAGEIQVYDNCDLSPTVVFNENIVEGDCPNNYLIRRVWTVTDDCENETFAIQELTVQDSEGPIFIDFPSNMEISCGAVADAATEVVATDNCGGEITYNMVEVANYDNCPYTLTRTWTAADICGNETVQSQVITLVDEEGPVFSNVPLAANVDCNNIPEVGEPTINDNCDDNPQMEMTETTEGEGCPYTIIRTWTATDKCGNETTASQTITVDDNTGPEIQDVPADIAVNCSELPEAPQLIAIDNCAGEIATEYSEVTNGEGCDITIIRTWTATDLCENTSSVSQTITVSDDEEPTFDTVFDIPYTVSCGDAIPVIPVVNAIDNCGEVTMEFEEISNDGVCESDQTIFRNWRATDACGNIATLQQIITVGDQNPPVFTEAAGELDVAICAGQIATVSAPNVTDGCSAVELNFNDETFDTNCASEQLVVRTYTATDVCGNNSTYVQNITIYGDITGTISNSGANCEVQLNLDCAGYSIMWFDDAGNTGSGNVYNPTLDASGIVTFAVTRANAPTECNAESFEFNYDCSNTCPQITSASTSELHLCSGSSFELISEVINGDDGTLIWYDDDGNVVADPSNVSITNTTCQEITTTYTAEYVSVNDFCPTVTMETAVVTIYPEISYDVTNDGCEIHITNYCESFNISWVDEYGKPGNDDFFTAEAGGQGTVTFTIFNTDASQAPLQCQFTTIIEDFDCGECPTLSQPTISANNICSGDFISLGINVNNDNGGSLMWYDGNDNLIPDPTKIFLNTENCDGEEFSFYASYTPSGEYCEIVVSDIATVTVYPQIDATVINDGCTVALNNINLCNNAFEIAWSDDSGNSGTGPIYNAADGSTGNVTFVITNTAANIPDNCATATFVSAYTCQTCPIITLDEGIPTAVCYGEAIPLSASVDPNAGGVVQWYNDAGVLLNDLTLDDLNYNNCDGAVINYYAEFIPSNTACPTVQTATGTVTIYPAITASAVSNGCNVILNDYCEDFTVTWEDSNGSTGTGDSFTQTNGATGSVTYTVTNPNGHNGCESATFTATANCSSSCPNLYNVECSPPTVCDGEAFSLIVAVSNLDGGTIQWFDENDNLIINTNDIVVDVDACEGGQFGYYAVYTPANESCGSVTSEMAYVTVFPNIIAEMTGENSCNVNLINECENLDIEWVDNLGNTGTGSSYTATPGSSGAVTFTVTNPATGVPASCYSESFGPFDYACSNCPLIYSPYCDPPVACEGDPFSLQVLVTDLDGGTIQWFDENDNAIDITDDIVLDINACEGGQFGYYAVYTPANANCDVVTTEMAFVTIYPSIIGNIQNNGCEVVLEDYCPSFPITWVDGDGNTGVGNTYTAAGPGTGSVTFTVNNPATGTPDHCQTMTFDSDYECIACPEIFNPVCDPPVICAGEGFSLNVGINNLDGGTLQWYDQSGNAITNSEEVVLDIDACAGGQFGYYVEYTPANANCPTVSTELTFVQVYPQINAEVVENGCAVNLTNTCPSHVISWTDDLGNAGTGTNYTGTSGNAGSVTYTVSNPVDGVPGGCVSQTYEGAYDCPICPEIATVSCNPSAICEGETFSLAVAISNIDGGTVQWFSEDGTPIYSTNDIVLDINACAGGQFGYYAEYTPANETCPVASSELAYVTIYPSINAQIVSDGCNVSVANYCEDFDVTWEDAVGNSGTGDSFSGSNGENGAVTFIVTNPNGIGGCQSNEYTTNYACIDCPTIFNPACSPPVICEGESFGLVVGFNNLDGGTLNWYDEQGNIITNTADIVLDLDECEGGTFGYYVEYTPSNTDCATIITETTYVTVYPQINADIVTSDCQVTIENYCPDFNISWVDDTGNTGDGDTYLGNGGAGTVSFSIANTGATGNCLSETFNASYNCGGAACPQLGTPSISSNDICSGESVSLSVELSNPNGGTLTWLDQDGNPVDPTDLVIDNNSCETAIHNYYAVYVSGDTNCPDINTTTVSVNVYPAISYETVTDGCSITITNYCENFWINWVDSQGKPGEGNLFEGSAGESGFVEFTIYNPTSGQIPLNCQYQIFTVDYACGDCPSILNPTATPAYACSGETIALDVTVSNDDGGTIQWFDANNNPVADPTNVVVNTTSCGDEIFGYYAIYTPASAGCAELTSSSTYVHVYPEITAIADVNDCEVFLVTSYVCEDFEIAWADDLGGSGTGATYIVADGSVGTVTYTVTNNTPGTPDACATATFTADFDCTKEILFDLALQKTLAAGQSSTVNVGDQVTYTITVYNQGQVTAQNITVSDYIPNGLTLNDADWSGTGSTVTTTVAGPILPGDNATVDITFTVTATTAGVIRNYAEISYAEDEGGVPQGDSDSYPDGDDSNDGVAQDDEIDNGNGDEDDHDFAEITIVIEVADCPELENPTISNPVVCSGSSISLDVTIINDDSGVLTWYTQDGTVVADPTSVTLNETGCGSTHSFYATYTPANTDCSEINSTPVTVSVYPAIAATVSSSDCQVVLSDYCSNFNVSWTDSDGANGTGTTYIAQEGTAGTVTFTVTNVNGVAGCESASFEGTYNCAEPIECPQIINPVVTPATICSGELFSLSAQIVNSDGGSIQWYDSNGTAVNDPSNLTASNTTCSPISIGYYAVYTPANGDCSEVNSSVTNVVVYPAITAEANSGSCSVTLSSNCTYNISWSDDLGNTGSTGFYNATEGTSGTVTFTLTDTNAPEGCNSATFEGTFDCAAQVDCPAIASLSCSPSVICSGGSFSLISQMANADGGSIQWYDENGVAVSDPNNLTLSNTTCSAYAAGYYAQYTPSNGDCEVVTSNLTYVTVYPEIIAEATNGTCSVSLTANCTYDVSWTDGTGNTGTGATYTASEGTSGTVTFTVTNANAPGGCNTATYSATYDCAAQVDCPAIASLSCSPSVICSGGSFSLISQMANADGGSIQWYDENGVAVSDPNNLTLSNTTCSAYAAGYYAQYTPSNGDCEVVTSNLTYVTVYPEIIAEATNGTCSVSLTANCTYDVSWTDGTGNTGTGATYTASEGTSGTVTFTVTNANAPESCNTATYSATYDCAAQVDCPAIASLSCSPSVICSGGSFSLISQMANADGGNIQWYDENGVAVSDPNNLTLSNTTCSAYAAGYYAQYTPSNGDCEVVTGNLTYVTVYPEIIAEANNGSCSVTLSSNCAYNISWSDDLGNTGSTGFYNATEGTSGTVTFTLTDANAPEGCNSATFEGTFDCAGQVDCPAIASLSCSPAVICSGGSFSLISQMANADGGSIQWYDENGVAVSDPNNLTLSNTTCSAYAAGYYAQYTPSNGDCEVVTGNLTYVTVYPEIIAEATNGTCSVSLTANCTYDVSWTDGTGNTGTGATYAASEGTSGTVTFTVTNANAPGTCNAATFSATYDCAAQVTCPAIANPVSTPSVICSGGTFGLTAEVTNDDGGSIQWYDANGVAVANPNNLTLSNTTCSAYTAGYYAQYTPSNGDCAAVTTSLTYVTVYPEINAQTTSGTCAVSLTANCAYNVSWTDGSGNTGTGATYTATQGTSGTVTFNVTNPNAPGTCSSASFSATYDCASDFECATLGAPTASTSVVCSGEIFSLSIGINGANDGSLTWYDQNGNTVSDPSNVSVSSADCNGTTSGYYAVYVPANAQCSTITSSMVNITVYPELTAVVNETDCQVYLSNFCTNYNVVWTDNTGNTGNGATFNAAPGQTGSVSFTITNPNVVGTCSSNGFSGTFNCPSNPSDCPILVNPACSPNVICEGDSFNLTVGIDNPDGGTIQWFDADGNPLTTINGITIDVDNCNGGQFGYYAQYIPSNGTCPTITSELAYVVVHPEITASVTSNECFVEIDNYCSTYNVGWTDSNGNTGTGDTYTATAGQSGTVTFTVNNPNAPSYCSQTTFVGTFNCPTNPVECNVTLDNPQVIPEIVCDGGVVALSVNVNSDVNGSLQWYDPNGNVVPDPNNVVVNSKECAGTTIGYYAIYTPTDPACSPVTSLTSLVQVYPSITGNTNVSSDGCTVSINPNCSNFTIVWQDNLGNTGSGATYQAGPGQSGIVTYTVSNLGNGVPVECSAASFSESFNCPGNTPCPSLTIPVAVPSVVCSGGTVSLTSTVNNPDGGTMQWYDTDGNAVNDPANAIVTTNDCNGSVVGFYSVYTSNNPNCAPVTSETTLVQVYPQVDAGFAISGIGCNVQIIDNCPNYVVTWFDNLGNSGSGTTYTATTGTSGNVTFTVTNPTMGAPATCASTTIVAPFDCFEDNPNIVCDTIEYCTEPIMPVLICEDFCGLTGPFTITEIDAVSGCVHEITESDCVSYTPFALDGQEIVHITACNATECRTIVVKINIDDDCDNDSPFAEDNTVDTNENTDVVIDVLGNDSDPDGDALSICDSTQPLNGSIVLVNGLFTYTPNQEFVGVDVFTYTICDGNGGTADAIVYVNVAGIMTELNANTDDITVLNDEIVGLDVLLNDVYPDGCVPMIVIVSSPEEGFITVSNNGIINYEPQPGFIGDISFTYQICCGSDCDLTTVSLKVTGDKPCDGLRIPTGFSPNGDGANERFTVDDLDECFADHHVNFKIFDRFGEAVYHNENYKNTEAWDGESIQGDFVAEGTYFYIMSITKGESIIEKTGSIRVEY